MNVTCVSFLEITIMKNLSLAAMLLSTTVVTTEQRAGSVVFGSGRCVQGIGAVFANQTSVEDAPDRASRATAAERADAGFPVH